MIIGHQGQGLVIYNVTNYTPVTARVTFDDDVADAITCTVEQTKPCSCPEPHPPHSVSVPRADVRDALGVVAAGGRVGDAAGPQLEVRGTFMVIHMPNGVQIAVELLSVVNVLRRSYELVPDEETVDEAIAKIFAEAGE